MSRLKQSFLSPAPVSEKLVPLSERPVSEERQVFTETDPATRIVIREQWFQNRLRDRADGPANIRRNAQTGIVAWAEWYEDGRQFEPSADVRAAWFQKEEQENTARIARLAVPSASASPAPAPG